MGYIYQADVYCEKCGREIRAELRAAGKAPEDELDHTSYDSDAYPKDADVERDESDTPGHCAKCGEFLHNPLTSAGYQNVKEQLDGAGVTESGKLSGALAAWASWYGFSYWTAEDCAEEMRRGREVQGWYSDEAY